MNNGDRVGRYRITGKIGEGAVGAVYRALDTRMGRVVALKFLRARFATSDRLRVRFRREGLIGAALVHPNICTVHDFDTHEGRPYIVMELLRGQSLSAHLVDGPLSVARLIDVGIDIAGALAKAHRRGIVHRDLKPANVFLTDEGCTKLLDFGVATPAESIETAGRDRSTDPGSDTVQGRLVGTIGYMSPEQARGEDLDGRSDLFSLGIVLYEAATGVQPFDAETSALIFDRLFHAAPASPLVFDPTLPRGLVRVVHQALTKSRASRYQSAAAMLADLEEVRDAGVADGITQSEGSPAVAIGGSR